MNRFDFLYTRLALPPTFQFVSFTVPPTSCLLVAASSEVPTLTTAAPTEAAASSDGPMVYNASWPFGLLLYVSAQSQKLFGSGTQAGQLFERPGWDYLILTLLTVVFRLHPFGV